MLKSLLEGVDLKEKASAVAQFRGAAGCTESWGESEHSRTLNMQKLEGSQLVQLLGMP